MSGAIFGAEAGGIDFTTGEEARNPFGLGLSGVQVGEGDEPASPGRVIGDLEERCPLISA